MVGNQLYNLNNIVLFYSMATLYLSNLGADPDKRKVEKEFAYYGTVRSVWLSKPPYGYGFVEFKHTRDGMLLSSAVHFDYHKLTMQHENLAPL